MIRAQGFARFGLLSLALSAAGVACSDVTDPFLPSTAAEFSAPAVYQTWWTMAQGCSGRTGDFSAVRWYSVPSNTVLRNDVNAVAYWTSAGNHIVLQEDRKYDGPTIRHEMLHAIAREPKHTHELFLDKCAGYVACGGNCVTEAGKAIVPSDALHVFPSQMTIDIAFSDAQTIVDGGNDWFALTLTVSNPSDRTVVVDLSDSPAGNTFGYVVARAGTPFVFGGVVPADKGVLTFAPGQTRRQVFDFFKSQLPRLPWDFTGTFGSSQTVTRTFDNR